MVKEDLEDVLGAKVRPTAVFEEQRLHGQWFHQALQLPAAKWEDEEEKHSRKMEQQMQSLRREQAWSTAGTGKSL